MPSAFRRSSGARGRLDAETGNAGGDEVPEQIAVVGGDLDDEALAAEVRGARDHRRVAGGVIQPALRHRREVRVVVVEKLGRLGIVFRLHQPALGADVELERVIALPAPQIRER